MEDSMIAHDSTLSTGAFITDLLIIGTVWFSDRIYDCLLFLFPQEFVHNILIDLKDTFGVIVAALGIFLMIIKIKKAQKK